MELFPHVDGFNEPGAGSMPVVTVRPEELWEIQDASYIVNKYLFLNVLSSQMGGGRGADIAPSCYLQCKDLDCPLGTFTQVKTLTLLQKNFRRSPHARELELEGDSKNLFNHRGCEKERHLEKCKEFWGVRLWVSQR